VWNSATTASYGVEAQYLVNDELWQAAGSSIAPGRRSGPNACARRCCAESTRGREPT